ncbi:response regulator [Marinobacteraceae bacterium S3BR75-40.1]
MTTPVLICDDSGMARKQMARALPGDWDIDVTFAVDGEDCLEKLRQGLGDILFLDLNMPGLDGYGVLEHVRAEELPTLVIVVSGDIQPEARARVLKLGAIDFIKKPTDTDRVATLLTDYGVYRPATDQPAEATPSPTPERSYEEAGSTSWQDVLQELSNVAMGQAGDLLARLLNVFIKLPIPKVNMLAASELRMALSVTDVEETWSGVCQGFIGSGIAGEALLLFSDSRFDDMAKLLGYKSKDEPGLETEVLMDMSSILTGAFLKGLGEQLDTHFGISHPSVLGKHVQISDLLEQNSDHWRKMLAIELNYAVEDYDIQCDLLLLFAEDSIPILRERLSYLMD